MPRAHAPKRLLDRTKMFTPPRWSLQVLLRHSHPSGIHGRARCDWSPAPCIETLERSLSPPSSTCPGGSRDPCMVQLPGSCPGRPCPYLYSCRAHAHLPSGRGSFCSGDFRMGQSFGEGDARWREDQQMFGNSACSCQESWKTY